MLYAEGNEMPLPTQEEVLICTPQTTAEEVGAFKTAKYMFIIVPFRSYCYGEEQ